MDDLHNNSTQLNPGLQGESLEGQGAGSQVVNQVVDAPAQVAQLSPRNVYNIRWAKILAVSAIGVFALVGLTTWGLTILHHKSSPPAVAKTSPNDYSVMSIPLNNLAKSGQLQLDQASQLVINGQLRVNNAIILTPIAQPKNSVPGEFYFNKTTNQPSFFNGSQYISLLGTGQAVSSIGGLKGNIELGPGLEVSNGKIASTIPNIPNSIVTSLQGQTGDIQLVSGTGIKVSGTTISNNGVTGLGGSNGSISVGAGLAVTNNTLASTTTITSQSSGLTVSDDGNGNFTLSLAGSSGTVALGPASPQIDSSTNPAISINKTGNGNLVDLQFNGTDQFVVNKNGQITKGSIDYSQITSTPSIVNSINGASGALSLGQGLSIAGSVLSNSGVTSLTGTSNQVIVSSSTGAVTLSLPQNIGITSTPTFAGLTVNGNISSTGSVTANSFAGDGSALTNLNASNISSGTLSDSRLNTDVTLQGNTFNGANELVQLDGSGALPVLNGAALINLNGANIQNGTVPNIALTNNSITVSNGANITGGSTVALGGTLTIGTVNNPTFSTSVTTPSLLSSGILNITAGSSLTVASTGATNGITIDTGNTTTTAGITIGGTNAASLTLGRSGVQASLPGGLTTNGSTITTANGNLTLGSGNLTTSGNINGQTINTNSNFLGTVTIQGNNALSLGTANSHTGVITFNGSGGAGTVALQGPATPNTGDFTLSIPAITANANICTDNSLCNGYAPASGSANYVQLQGSSPGTQQTGDFNISGTAIAGFFSGDGSAITNLDGSNISSGTVDNARLVNSGALDVTAGNGLSGGGSVALGGSTTLDVVYGSSTNTAVQGSTTLICPSGTGNLTGGGDTITLGSGGSCSNLDIVSNPSFTGNLTVQGGSTTIGTATQAGSLALNDGTGNTLTLQSSTMGGNLTLNLPAADGSLGNCLETDGLGNLSFQSCTGGAGGGVTSITGTVSGSAAAFGIVTINNALTTGSSITIQNATTSLKGIASFNSSQFSVSSGAVSLGTVPIANGGTGVISTPTNGELLIGNGSGYSLNTLSNTDGTITIVNGTGSITISAPEAGECTTCADYSLDNLRPVVAINQSLLPGVAGAIDLGGSTVPYEYLYLSGSSSTPGSNNFKITGTSTGGQRTITLPDASGTVCLDASVNNCSYVSLQSGTLSPQTGGLDLSGTVQAETSLKSNGDLSVATTATIGGTLTVNTINSDSSHNLSIAPSTGHTLTLGATGASQTTSIQGSTVGFTNGTATYGFNATSGSYTICDTSGNCAGTGGGVTTTGGTTNDLAKFSGSGTIVNSIFSDDGSTGSVAGSFNVNAVNTSGNSVVIANTHLNTNNANLAQLNLTNASTSGSTTINGLAINPVGTATSGANVLNGISLNNVTTLGSNSFYALNVGTGYNDILRYNGTQLISGSGLLQNAALDSSQNYSNLQNVTNLNATGNLTVTGTINTNTFTSSALTFGAASTATISSAASQALNITGNATSAFTTSAGNLTLDATAASATVNLGTGAQAKTIQIGTTSTNTGNTQTIGIGNLNAAGTTNVTIGTGSSATAGTLTLQSKGALTLGNAISSSVAIDTAAAGTITIGGTNATTTIGRAGAALTLNGSNFSVTSGGAVTASGTLTVNTINSDSSHNLSIAPSTGHTLTLGATGASQTTSIQGSTVGFTNGTATYGFNATSGSYTICDTSGNCAGTGGGVTTTGGTTNDLAKFSGSGTIVNSIFSDDGSTGTVGGALNIQGNLTGTSGTFTVASSGSNALSLNSGSGTLVLGGSTGTIQRTASSLTLDVNSTSDSTLTVTNSNVSHVANLSVEGSVNVGSGQAFKINGTSLNVAGTLSDVAYLDQNNSFSATGTTSFAGNLTAGTYNGQTINTNSIFSGTVAIQGSTALTLGQASTNSGDIIFQNNAGSHTVSLKAADSDPASSFTLTLPTALGSSGDCLEQTNGTGTLGFVSCASGLGGSGTSGNIPLFTGSTTLGNSLLTQSGTTVSIQGSGNDLSVGDTISVGTNGASGIAGTIAIKDGSNPGRTVGLQAQQAGSSYTLQLPTTADAGSSCLVLQSVGGGVDKITSGSCAAGGSGGNINASGTTSAVGSLQVITGYSALTGYTSGISLLQDNGSGIGVNTTPQASYILTVGSSNKFNVTDAGQLEIGTTGSSPLTLATNGNISNVGTLTAAGLLQTSVGGQALTLSGAPTNSATQSLFRLGSAIASGNTATNGGTYIGLNEPSSGAGSAADFLNFQVNGSSKLKVDNSGNITALGTVNGVTIGGSGALTTGSGFTLTLTGNSTINQNLATTSSPTFAGLTLTNPLSAANGGTGTDTSGASAGSVLIYNATTGKFEANKVTSSDGSVTVTSSDGSVDLAVASCTSCANTALSNLSATTSINSSLQAQTGVDLGSTSNPFRNLYIYGSSGSPGSNNFKITGTSTGGQRTITLPDASGTVCLDASVNNCSYVSLQSGTLSPQTGGLDLSGTVQAETSLKSNGDLSVATTATIGGTLTVNTINSDSSHNLSIAPSTGHTLTLGATGASQTTSIQGSTVGFTNGTATYGFNATSGSYTICDTSGNCAGTGGGVTTTGGTTNDLAKFSGSGTIVNSIFSDDGSTGSVAGSFNVNAVNTSGNSVVIANTHLNTNNANLAQLNLTNASTSGSTTINGLAINPVGTATSGANVLNGISLNNVTTLGSNSFYALNVGTGYNDILRYNGTQLISGSGLLQNAALDSSQNYSNLQNVTNLNATGNLTVTGTINTNTFTSSALTFGAASTATISSAASQALNITGNATSAFTTSAGNLTLDATAASATVNLGTGAQAKTIQIGTTSTNTGNTQTIGIGNLNAAGTTNVTIGTGSSATAGTLTLQSKGALTLGNAISSSVAIDTAAAGTITIGGTNATTTIGRAGAALTLNGSNFSVTSGGAVTASGTLTVNTINSDSSHNLSIAPSTGHTLTLGATGASQTTSIQGSTVGFTNGTATYGFNATSGSYTICDTSGNCAGTGGGVTTTGGTTNDLAKFSGSGTIVNSIFSDDGSTGSVAGSFNVNAVNTSGNSVVIANTHLNTNNANLAQLNLTNASTSGSTTINGLAINPVGTATSGANVLNGISLNNVTTLGSNSFYALNVGTGYNDILRYNGTQLISGSGLLQNAALDSSQNYSNLQNVTNLNATGNLTVTGTINTNTFTSSALTFGAASTATISSAASQALNITGNATSAFTTSAGNLTLDATAASATVNLGTGAQAKTIQIGTTSTNTGNTQTIGIGNLNAAGTTNVTIGTGSSATAGTLTLQSKGALTLGNAISSSVAIDTAAAGTITIGGTNATTTIGRAGAALTLNGSNFSVTSGGNVAASGTYNTNTFTSSALTFGAASTATISSAASQALNITGNATSAFTTSAGNLTLDATAASATVNLGTGAQAKTIQIGTTSTNTGNTQTIGIGNLNAAGTTNVTIGTGSSATAGTLTLQSKGALTLGNAISSSVAIDTAAAGTITIGGTNATTTIGRAGAALTLNGSNFSVTSGGNVAASGTYNTNTFTSSALTFGAAGTATIESASGQALNVYAQGATALTLDSSSSGGTVSVGNTNATTVAIGNSGSTNTIKGSTTSVQSNSTTAFRVQNSGGTSTVLNVDTTNSRVSVGTNGTATGQLYVSGSVPTSNAGSTATGITSAKTVFVQGNYAYVLGTSGLVIDDISNPVSPVKIGSIATDISSPTSLYVSGQYAFVTDNTNGLLIFNIANPNSPAFINNLTNSDLTTVTGVYVQGDFAFVVGSSTTKGGDIVIVLDISNPFAQTFAPGAEAVGDSSNSAAAVTVVGNYTYMVDTGGLSIFDNSAIESATTTTIGSSATGLTAPKSIYVQGRYAYIADSTNGLVVYDISNPASPTRVTNATSHLSAAKSIYVQGRYAYIADSTNGLVVYDISNPASPTYVGNLTSGLSTPVSIMTQGRYAYIADSTNGLVTFDLGGAYAQQLQVGGTETGTLQVDGNAAVSGDTSIAGGLQVSGFTGLNIVDVSSVALVEGALEVGSVSSANGVFITNSGTIATTSDVTVGGDLTVSGGLINGNTFNSTEFAFNATGTIESGGPTGSFANNLSVLAGSGATLFLDTASGGGTVDIATTNAATVNIGTVSGAVQAITIGSSNTGTTINLQTGVTTLSLASGSSTGAKVKTTTNSTAAFSVINSGSAAIFTVDTSNTQIILGTTSNNVTFNPTSGSAPISCTGNGCQAKKIVLTPEYAGAVLDTGSQSNDIGSMVSGFDTSQRESFYQWTTSQGATETYDIVAQIPLPSDFGGWTGSTPISIDDKATSGGVVSAALWDTSGTIATNWGYTSNVPGCSVTVSTSWATRTGCTVTGGTWAANGVITLRIRLSTSASSGGTQLGNIVLNYTSTL